MLSVRSPLTSYASCPVVWMPTMRIVLCGGSRNLRVFGTLCAQMESAVWYGVCGTGKVVFARIDGLT